MPRREVHAASAQCVSSLPCGRSADLPNEREERMERKSVPEETRNEKKRCIFLRSVYVVDEVRE